MQPNQTKMQNDNFKPFYINALKKSNNQKRPIHNDSKKTNEALQKQLQTLNRKQSRRNKSRSVSPAAI